MNRFKSILSRAPNILRQQPKVQEKEIEQVYHKKYQRFKRSGPQLLITRILSIHGPLQNKEIWRVYERMKKESQKKGEKQRVDFFPSLTKLKATVRLMRITQKVVSNGYDRKAKQFKGWKLNEPRAFKYVHPEAIKKIQNLKDSKDLL